MGDAGANHLQRRSCRRQPSVQGSTCKHFELPPICSCPAALPEDCPTDVCRLGCSPVGSRGVRSKIDVRPDRAVRVIVGGLCAQVPSRNRFFP